ncbi:hypothetical protein [Streptomyces sp. S.PB5]|nr:hypothetical protein [Streptomyces sp. S.PB5]MDN3021371.1 hypothetical protein [Streptomyces sp. S.PB5]
MSVDRTEVTMSRLVSGDAREGEDYDLADEASVAGLHRAYAGLLEEAGL